MEEEEEAEEAEEAEEVGAMDHRSCRGPPCHEQAGPLEPPSQTAPLRRHMLSIARRSVSFAVLAVLVAFSVSMIVFFPDVAVVLLLGHLEHAIQGQQCTIRKAHGAQTSRRSERPRAQQQLEGDILVPQTLC